MFKCDYCQIKYSILLKQCSLDRFGYLCKNCWKAYYKRMKQINPLLKKKYQDLTCFHN